ncbi:hypothetical protein LCGC14_1088950 [marine sediment metagenome]|uniref:Uncharacterized protein n=1 Tax=marine sediment metagenome TaxID=412755 RepID=A0A0F9PW67_9ZZZZ
MATVCGDVDAVRVGGGGVWKMKCLGNAGDEDDSGLCVDWGPGGTRVKAFEGPVSGCGGWEEVYVE